MKLLTRDLFRALTLERNGGICVIPSCKLPAVDAHHILNRNLFTGENEAGGYFLENGAGLCSGHHLEAEATLIGCEDLYFYCGIDTRALPESFSPDKAYDTWGNEVISKIERKPGPLFKDEGFQKIMKRYGLIWLFAQHQS